MRVVTSLSDCTICARVLLPYLRRLTQFSKSAASGLWPKKSWYCWVTKSAELVSGSKPLALKLAVTLRAIFMATVQVSAVPLQAPPQPTKLLPLLAWARKVIVVLVSTVATHAVPQSSKGAPSANWVLVCSQGW